MVIIVEHLRDLSVNFYPCKMHFKTVYFVIKCCRKMISLDVIQDLWSVMMMEGGFWAFSDMTLDCSVKVGSGVTDSVVARIGYGKGVIPLHLLRKPSY